MKDIEILGLEIRDYSALKTKKNNDQEMINKIEQINRHHDNYQKYGKSEPIRTDSDYQGCLDKMYIVHSNFGQLDWMGYGYRHKTYIIANNLPQVMKYCNKRFGKQQSFYYYNIQHFTYVIDKVDSKEYLKEVNEILYKHKRYNDIKCINPNYRTIKMKIVPSEGIPIRLSNGVIEYEGRGELERYYEPDPLDEINLISNKN